MGAAKLVISLDLELFWGHWPRRRPDDCRDDLLAARRAVPTLLDLFSDHRVRVTWPVVGFLFCRSKDELLSSLPRRLPTGGHPRQSPYAHIARIGENEHDDPIHYAPSLVDAIAAQPGQEVACHTFSNFAQQTQTTQFRSDLKAAIDVARRQDIILRSLVFPDNRVCDDALQICRSLGISAYRGRPPSWPYISGDLEERGLMFNQLRRWVRAADAVVPLTGTRCVASHAGAESPPVNVPATRRLRPFAARGRPWLAAMQRRRLFTEMDWAARNEGIFHLWGRVRDFGRHLTRTCDELSRILDRFDRWRQRGEMESVTMHEVVMGSETSHARRRGQRHRA